MMMNSKWLGRKLHTRVKENPNLGIPSIVNGAHTRWNVGICLNLLYFETFEKKFKTSKLN